MVKGHYFVFDQGLDKQSILKNEIKRIRAAQNLINQVRIFRPDIIYLRWAMYVFPIHQIKTISPVILEINTNDVFEHQRLGFSRNIYNRITRGIILRNARGLVFTTRELSSVKAFSCFNKPFKVISNSINLTSAPYYPAPANKPPHLLFVGTSGFPWQGVDKLVSFADQFPDIEVDLVGFTEIPGIERIPVNIKLHDYLEGKAYEIVLSNADAAIGTLALHRKGMQEASPLKIRDYLARGIPCVLPYTDTDLSNLNLKCLLKISNTEKNLEISSHLVHDFVYNMRGKRVQRDLIQSYIDNRPKEVERLKFFKQLLNNQG